MSEQDRHHDQMGTESVTPSPRPAHAEPDDPRAGTKDRARWASWLAHSADEADDLSDVERLGLRIAATHLLDAHVAAQVAGIDVDSDAIRDLYTRLWAEVERGRAALAARTPQPAEALPPGCSRPKCPSCGHRPHADFIGGKCPAFAHPLTTTPNVGADLPRCPCVVQPEPAPAVPDGEDAPRQIIFAPDTSMTVRAALTVAASQEEDAWSLGKRLVHRHRLVMEALERDAALARPTGGAS